MGRTITVVNQKGGVGKSTTAVNLGAYMSVAGKRVLVVDLDPQGNATSGIGIQKATLKASMYDVLIERAAMSEIIQPTLLEGLHVAPATIALAGAEIELVSAISREFRLRERMREVVDLYDYILVDCPPSLGLLTLNGLAAADSVLIPIQCEYYALEGLGQLMQTIEMVRTHVNAGLEVEGVVLTMFDGRTNLSQQVADDVRGFFEGRVRVFESVIPRNVRLSEAPSYGQPINVYDDRCRGALAYQELAAEVLGA
ncbi:MAG: ParA family protein [Limnochordia bacterium]|jgi:chromosome partitioning protein